MNNDFEAVDLFAGPGGWDVAARQLGFETIGIEWDKPACETRRAAGFATIQADVRSISPLHPTMITPGLIASPSCQSFSAAGNGKGRAQLDLVLDGLDRVMRGEPLPEYDDERTSLTLEPMRWIKARFDAGIPFTWIAMEQVPSILVVWQAYAVHLEAMGYNVATSYVQAEQYGVPQTRKRAILLAHRDKPVAMPEPTHMKYKKGVPQEFTENGLLPWVSMADALGATDTLRSNYGTGGDPKNRGTRDAEEPAFAVTSKVGRNKWTRFAGAGRTAQQTSGQIPREISEPGHTITGKGTAAWLPEAAVPGDTSWTGVRPSPTIVGSFSPDVVAAPGWRKAGDGPRLTLSGSVRVTVEEAAILQSFPHDFEFLGSKTKRYEQVGNAAPPALTYRLLETLVSE